MSRPGYRFVPDHGFEKAIRADPYYHLRMAERARRVLPHVLFFTPEETGAAVRSLFVIGNTIVSRDPFWHLIEFGSINNPPYAPMRGGVLSAGLKFRDAHEAGPL